jgi:hypothetical protein
MNCNIQCLTTMESVRFCHLGLRNSYLAHIPVVLVHLLDIPVNDLQGYKLIICRRTSGDEEERGITTVDYLRIWQRSVSRRDCKSRPNQPLYSRKLHILVRRASTSCDTSLMIFAFSFGDSVVNHFASLCGRISGQLGKSTNDGEYTRLYPAVRAGSNSCKVLALRQEPCAFFQGNTGSLLDCHRWRCRCFWLRRCCRLIFLIRQGAEYMRGAAFAWRGSATASREGLRLS